MSAEVKELEEDMESLQASAFDGYRPPPLWVEYADSKGEIVSDESFKFKIFLYLAIFFLSTSYPLGNQFSLEEPGNEIYFYLFKGIFPIVGLLCFALTCCSYLRLVKFGKTTFRINDKIGKLGGNLEGTLTTTVNLEPRSDYTVSLECIKTIVSAGSSSKSRDVVLWRGLNRIPRLNYKSTEGIPISFSIPSDLPQSNKLYGDGQIQWILKILASTRGVSYKASFEVPVFPSR